MAYYRNRVTDQVSFHPVSGLGETFNAEEIADNGKPVKPRTSLAPTAQELKDAKGLLKDNSGTPNTTGATTGTGDSNQEGDQ